jgi:hypothetical protein
MKFNSTNFIGLVDIAELSIKLLQKGAKLHPDGQKDDCHLENH